MREVTEVERAKLDALLESGPDRHVRFKNVQWWVRGLEWNFDRESPSTVATVGLCRTAERTFTRNGAIVTEAFLVLEEVVWRLDKPCPFEEVTK